MTEPNFEPVPPVEVAYNGPFNRVYVINNKEGAVNIISEVVGATFLGLVALITLIQLIRVYGENRKLMQKLATAEAQAARRE